MSNGETILEVKSLLENPKGISVKSGVILSLRLLAEIHKNWSEDHEKLMEVYPVFKEMMEEKKTQKDSVLQYKRVAIGTLITNALLWLIHIFKVVP